MAPSEVECVDHLMQVGPALLNVVMVLTQSKNMILLSSVCIIRVNG